MKLEEVIKDFKFHCKFERNLSNKTMEAYSIDLNQFEQFKDYKNLDINEFDKHKLKDYVQSLYELDFKAKTIKRKVAVLKAFNGKTLQRYLIAFCMLSEERSCIFRAVYRRLFRSINVAKQPLLFPRLETIESSSQCPNICRSSTSSGRSEIDRPTANLPRFSGGRRRLPLWRSTFSHRENLPWYNQL